MIWRLREQTLSELQPERQGTANELNVVVGLVDGVARRERVADHVDRVSPQGTADALDRARRRGPRGSDQLLALSTTRLLPAVWQPRVRVFTSGVAIAVTVALVIASADFVRIERATGDAIGLGIPTWAVVAVLPAGFALILVRILWRAGERWTGRAAAALGIAVPFVLALVPPSSSASILFPAGLVIVAATALGMPIFAAIGGAALILFWGDGTPINAVPGETYRLTTSTMLPAVPLFALGGYILAAGGASRRLTRLFTSLVGWMPGGLAIVTTAVLAFFTPLTGASGVTIVSMGGLLLPVLVGAR
jgi:C4-dicarboxylate transporter, DctM subunit